MNFGTRKNLLRYLVLAFIWATSVFYTQEFFIALTWTSFVILASINSYYSSKKSPSKNRQRISFSELLLVAIWSTAPALVVASSSPERIHLCFLMMASGCLIVLGFYRHDKRPYYMTIVTYIITMGWLLASNWGEVASNYIAVASVLILGTFISIGSFSYQANKRAAEAKLEKICLINSLEKSENKMRAAMIEAENANEFKTRFLANMSHEIRTPLNGIIGMTDVLLRDTSNSINRERVALIKKSGNMLNTLINEILDLSKIQSGTVQIKPTQINIVKCLKETAQFWIPSALENGNTLSLKVSKKMPKFLELDEVRFLQCVNNVLSNAIKFTENGTIVLSASYSRKNGEDTLLVSVKDSGIGMSAEAQDIIFDAFSQAESSISHAYGGTGLGLSVTRSLCQLMGGSVTVESTLGQGTVFNLMFRVKEGHMDIAEPMLNQSCTESVFHNIEILYAEDNDTNAIVVSSLLLPLGVSVSRAKNGQAAVNMALSKPYDLILMDIKMPIMNGIEATILIKNQSGPNQATPIVAITANAMLEDQNRYLQAGMNDFCAKPITFDSLRDVVMRNLQVDTVNGHGAQKYPIVNAA